MGHSGAQATQIALEDLGLPLAEVTFVVLDLETTGSGAEDEITEVGAVKVRGGEVLGEFHTLVDPGRPVPPLIVTLTGLTTALLSGAPRVPQVLPGLLEFLRGCVLVAHNAPFDVGFLRRACEKHGYPWVRPPVVDTARLARAVVSRDEVRNHRLGSLAVLFRAGTVPDHRALHDARATVDVLHGLLGRLGNLGVNHLPDLLAYSAQVTPAVRRRRTLADGLPHGPGVYMFVSEHGEVLYVGRSVDVRTRVRSYFTAAEPRRRMREMVQLAARVDVVECATLIEAQVREIRLIAQHEPRFNRRSKHPERQPWVKVTVEPYPRLSVVRSVKDDESAGACYLGPFGSTRQAELAVEAVHSAFPLRRCTRKLPLRPAAGAGACALAEIGRCGAPCTGGVGHAEYANLVQDLVHTITAGGSRVEQTLIQVIDTYSQQQRFEDAAKARDRRDSFLRAAARRQRVSAFAGVAEVVAARPRNGGGWEFVLARHGKLAGSAISPPRTDPLPTVASLVSTGEVIAPAPPPRPAGSVEESELLLRWMEQEGTRLVQMKGTWASPAGGAQRWFESL